MTSIKVVDSIMGSGKTNYIIQTLKDYIEEKRQIKERSWDIEQKKYLVITPYLDQIKRIIENVPEAIEPVYGEEKNKSKNLVSLLKNGTDIIVCTHNLFLAFADFHLLDTYTLLIDEAIDVIEMMHDEDREDGKTISTYDVEILIKGGYVKENNERFLEWIGDEYSGIVYADIIKYLKNKILTRRGDRIFKLLYPELFNSCKEIYVFTYMFEAQNMYYYCKYFDIQSEYWFVVKKGDKYNICIGREQNTKRHFPIHIYNGHLNYIDDRRFTKNWYSRRATDAELKKLRNDIYNYLHNQCGVITRVGNVIWTTFKIYSEKLKYGKCTIDKKSKTGKITKGNFVSCTTRATNNHRNANVVVYAVNRYQKPEIKQFFEERPDIKYDEDKFALQEMLQFLWRSAIREGKQIYVYIPSKRMRNMLIDWISC